MACRSYLNAQHRIGAFDSRPASRRRLGGRVERRLEHWMLLQQLPLLNSHLFHPPRFHAILRPVSQKILFWTGSRCVVRFAREREWIDAHAIESDGIEVDDEDRKEFAPGMGFSGRRQERDYDKDPEFAEILGSCLDDPRKAQSKMEERLRRKRNKILHSKTGSPIPMNVKFNKFNFSNSYIWIEFYNAPLQDDVSLICDTIRSWHILGRLGGCNSLNMQLSQSPIEKRPLYDPVQGANVTPTTFYNIGDFEIQDNLARIWVDIGTREPLILDILINALTQLSSDYVGIKQLVLGGSEFERWKEDPSTEDSDFSVHKI